MYKYTEQQMILPHEFFLPFGGRLNPNNKWCQLAEIIPWAEIEEKYAKNFKNLKTGQVAHSVRMALGSLIIQNLKGLSDQKTVEEIVENPYMQYFLGLPEFIEEPPFDPSLMVHFRKRLGKEIINEMNELIVKEATKANQDDSDDDEPKPEMKKKNSQSKEGKAKNSGKLILDATCVPADIHYPTDIWLLNQVREALEEIIDTLHAPHIGSYDKPRTYRNLARKAYLNIEKKKRLSAKVIRKAVGQQLRYVRRDLKIIKQMSSKSSLTLLNRRQYRNLLVSNEIYRQQWKMYQTKKHQVEDRIVSLYMPHVRPIVRGKAGSEVEFGAKLAISVCQGFSFMERLDFNAFNEGKTLIKSAENYKRRTGYYPEAILADKIYRNRDNLQYCKKHGIRLSGPPLGRPTKDQELLRKQERQERRDMGMRNAVEGKFGEGKRFYGMDRVMAHLQETTETVIAMQLLVMNLEKRLRLLFIHFFKLRFWVLNGV